MSTTIIPKNRRTQDGTGNPIGSLSGAINTHDADVHTKIFSRNFIDYDSATESPSVAITAGDVTILVADTTGFTVGLAMVIKDVGGSVREHHFTITAIVVNTSITVDRPIDFDYTTSATLEIVITNISSVGSLAVPIIYEIIPPIDEIWHITRVLISMVDTSLTKMDDGKFGNLTAIANGMVLRENKTVKNTIAIWKTNGAMVSDFYDVTYDQGAPAGDTSLRGRFTLTKRGAGGIVRLDGSASETLQIIVQDDISDIDSIKIKAQGHLEG